MTPASITDHWDEIRPALESFLDHSPAELYGACLTGEATLYRCPEGFVVLARELGPAGPELLVWAASGKGGGNLARYWPDLCRIGKRMGCVNVVARVRNAKVAELLERGGWAGRLVEYARSIE